MPNTLRVSSKTFVWISMCVCCGLACSDDSMPASHGDGGSDAAVGGKNDSGSSGGTGGSRDDGGAGTHARVDAATSQDAAVGDDMDAGDQPAGVYPAPHPAAPKLVSLDGPVLANPKLVPIYFDSDDMTLISKTLDFVTALAGSQYWTDTTAEYGVGDVTAAAAVKLTEVPGAVITDDDIQAFLAAKLNANDVALPAADANTVYALFYPAGTSVTLQGNTQSCVDFGSYHNSLTLDVAHGNQHVAYVVVPRCANFDGLSDIDGVTGVTSGELIDAVTDPYPQDEPAYNSVDADHAVWTLIMGGSEVSSLCSQEAAAFIKPTELGFTVQRTWSNLAAKASHDPCVPAIAGSIYFNAVPVLTEKIALFGATTKGITIPVGATKTISVDLFSEAKTAGPMTVMAYDYGTINGGNAALSFAFDKDHGSNGDQLKLKIKALHATNTGLAPFAFQTMIGSESHLWVGLVHN